MRDFAAPLAAPGPGPGFTAHFNALWATAPTSGPSFLANQAHQSVTASASGGLFELASNDDTLTAGAGTDIFALLTTAVGNDTISGFNTGSDMLDFSAVDHSGGWSAGTTAAAILAGATSVGGNTVFTLDGHDTITLQGVAIGSLTAANFHV